MKTPIGHWTREYIDVIRTKSVCVKRPIGFNFSNVDMEQARLKLESLYGGRIYIPFVERILILAEIY